MSEYTNTVAMNHVHLLRADRIELGVRAPQQKGMRLSQHAPYEVEGMLAYLKAMNAKGADIYVRPALPSPIVLVDDLNLAAAHQLAADASEPPIIVETSPDNYQAWVYLTRWPLRVDELTAIARKLATRYGGDPNAASWHQFGRLAGFTNRKLKHQNAKGQFPYVRIRPIIIGVRRRVG